MERDSFIYKSHCELGITSHVISPDGITATLNIAPYRSFIKGEKSLSNHSGAVITKPHHLWAFRTATSELEKETISHHIEQIRAVFLSKTDILKTYKSDDRFDVTFWFWIETDNAGIGFDLSEDEMSFLHSISNRVHFSLIAKGS